MVIRWITIAALALAYVISASAVELAGKVVRVTDGDTLTIRTVQPLDYQIRIPDADIPQGQ